MLIIRFLRTGKKHQPSFKIVVVQKEKSAKAGSFLEDLGFFNPLLDKVSLKKERILYWISKGASVSDTARNLLIKNGVIKGKKVAKDKLPKKKEEVAKAAPAPEAPKEEAKTEPETPVDTQNSAE
ncbi:MAG: 30S ribosomal protein S16 [Candidatus Pacebacteria bacterium]|nr:30S ribosomal protein S16 [Candidatus Paceibacterota bacterium]